jgi:hypothetical protein
MCWHTGVMANPEHLAILKEGSPAWNRWREENPLLGGPDFSEADLSGALLVGMNLTGANFTRANLRGANLGVSNLRYARLQEADLTRASLHWTHFDHSFFCEANLAEADIAYTSFTNVSHLSCAIGLESVKHAGPSSIGIDTIFMSEGKIPHSFLRGAGVPENFIQYMASLVFTGIEFYSLFISYSTKDQEFAERLHGGLQAKGVRCWFDRHDMHAGKKLHEQIDAAIRGHDKLLLILSPESMASEWVKTEIAKARKREISEKRRVLFPIRLCSMVALRAWECFDADTGKDSAREIREYFIPDFSNWKDHDSYRKAFDRLLHDLRGETNPDTPLPT